MVDPTTTNLVMAQPTRGSNVGTWDTPVNSNTGILDQAFGSVTTLAPSTTPITLAASQAQNAIIRLTGTLAANVAITMASIYKFWTIDNQLTNSPSSFCVTLVSTSGASIIGCPPGTQDVFYDGTSVKYRNLGQIGEYWDYAGSAVPSWVTASTVPPYLNCNGTSFSSVSYPILANLLGTTTLPDSKGRTRFTLNQTSSRITSTGSGLDGNTLFASGGDQLMQSHTHAMTDPGHSHSYNIPSPTSLQSGSGPTSAGGALAQTTGTSFTGISINTAGSGGSQNIPPAYVGGITMIRAG